MSNETIAWKICYTENGQYRTVLSEHNSVGDYRAIDPMASSIALCTAPVSVEPVNWPAVEARISEFVNEYEMVGEDEQGRDGHYTPNESERALILDAMHGVLADDELMALLRPAARVAAQPDLTQQTLDDVMAGIPARDAEIAALQAQQDADKVDAALAEMVHAMFRSANCIPVTRITIDRKQYDAAIDAARKEQA